MSATDSAIEVDSSYHYPPELLELLTDAIPCLVKSKQAIIDLFAGAGVPSKHLSDWKQKVRTDRDSVKKYEIARSVLCRVNADGDVALGVRREILRRISAWEDFSTCYDNDRYKAMGLVSQICKVVDVKDSFTRMSLERERERRERQAEYTAKLTVKQKRDEGAPGVKGCTLPPVRRKESTQAGQSARTRSQLTIQERRHPCEGCFRLPRVGW